MEIHKLDLVWLKQHPDKAAEWADAMLAQESLASVGAKARLRSLLGIAADNIPTRVWDVISMKAAIIVAQAVADKKISTDDAVKELQQWPPAYIVEVNGLEQAKKALEDETKAKATTAKATTAKAADKAATAADAKVDAILKTLLELLNK